jgi:trimethylamine:corrinoid methyltransferase-like protein
MDNYRDEQWQPDLFNRNNFQVWTEKGQKDTQTLANEKVKWILENYQPEQLPDDVLQKLEEIARDATDAETLAVSKTKTAKRRRKFRAV